MSAFQVSNKHIDAMVAARQLLKAGHFAVAPNLSDDEFGRLLIRENMASLAARYRDPIDEAEIAAYTYTPCRLPMVVALIKAVHCYQYQACEHEGWEKSDAAGYCREMLDGLSRQLPGYNDAPWGID